jgi:CrcB protein
MSLILVMTGGAIGAGARHLVGRATLGLGGSGPVGTLTVNLLGGLLMGVLVGVLARGVAGEPSRLFLGVGVLGGFTTFSAFSLDVFVLLERGAVMPALGYALACVIGSIAALAGGVLLVRAA